MWNEERTLQASYILAYLHDNRHTRAAAGAHEKYSRYFSNAERDYQQRIRVGLQSSGVARQLLHEPVAFTKHMRMLSRPGLRKPKGSTETEIILENMIKNLDWFLKPAEPKPNYALVFGILTVIAFLLMPLFMPFGEVGALIWCLLIMATVVVWHFSSMTSPDLTIAYQGDEFRRDPFFTRRVINATELYWYLSQSYADMIKKLRETQEARIANYQR